MVEQARAIEKVSPKLCKCEQRLASTFYKMWLGDERKSGLGRDAGWSGAGRRYVLLICNPGERASLTS